MDKTGRLTTREVAELLGVSESQVRSLRHRHNLGYRPGAPGTSGTFSASLVTRLHRQRQAHTAPGRVTRQQAAKYLGVTVDRLNQIIRAEPDQLGRREHAGGRVSLSRAKVEALGRRRTRAPRYPRAGSVWPEGMKRS